MSRRGHQPTYDGARLANEVDRDVAPLRNARLWREHGTPLLAFAATVATAGASSVSVRCPGARLGKYADACFTRLAQPVGTFITAEVFDRDTVLVTFANLSGVTISVGDQHVRVSVEQ